MYLHFIDSAPLYITLLHPRLCYPCKQNEARKCRLYAEIFISYAQLVRRFCEHV